MSLLTRIKKTFAGETEEPRETPPVEPTPAASEESSEATAIAPVDSQVVLSVLCVKVAEFSNGQLSAEEIDPVAVLFDFGYVDSLSAGSLIAYIDTEYGVAVTELDLVGSLNHLQALADHIEGQRAGSR